MNESFTLLAGIGLLAWVLVACLLARRMAPVPVSVRIRDKK